MENPVFTLSGVTAIQGISYPPITIDKGKMTFVCGESGCGKSTLLKLLNGTMTPVGGQILYKGENIDNIDTIILRRQVLLVSQNVFLFDETVEKNFQEFYGYLELPAPGRELVKEYLRLCTMEDGFIDQRCQQMSGGERQRVYLAICLSLLTGVLLLDEPTSALDGETSKRLLTQIKEFTSKRKMTVVCVSHDRALATEFADEILELRKGESL